MRTNHDFTIDHFIAKMSALRSFDRVVAGVRVAVHEVGMQDTHVRSMHLRDQAMWLEPEVCVNTVRTSGVENPVKERSRRCANCACTDTQQHDGGPCL
jgi:hypothetical protein